MDALLSETERCPDHQILDGGGDENLAHARERHHTGAGVHPDATDMPIYRLDLAGVDARADLDPDRANVLDHPFCGTHCLRRVVEGGEEAVAREVLFSTTFGLEAAADDRPESDEERAPSRVAQLGGDRGGTDDVDEQDRRETPFALTPRHGLSTPSGPRAR